MNGAIAALRRRNIRKGPWTRWKRVLLAGYLLLIPLTLHHYIDWQSAGCVAGLIALLLTPSFSQSPPGSYRYGIGALLFMGLFWWVPVKTVLYLGMSCGGLFLWESWYGRVGRTVPFVLLLLSPVTDYAMNLFSFPIRLQLTEVAGRLMRSMGVAVHTAGNMLSGNGHEFSVDPACMGLHMLLLSLLAGLLLLNFYQSRWKREIGVWAVLLLLLFILGLNIVANLCRIVGLVVFCILPENPMHGLLGMVCMVFYVLAPMLPVIRWIVRRTGVVAEESSRGMSSAPGRAPRSPKLLAGNLLVFVCILVAAPFSLLHDRRLQEPDEVPAPVPGYTVRCLPGHVLQFNNGRSLVYIKPIPAFYYTDHLPAICWQGNGYAFHLVQEERVGAKTWYTGLLQKDTDTLYTAWWYDNGSRRTTGQLEWRRDVLGGGHRYSLVNITTASRKELEEEVRRVLEENPFREVIGRNR